MPEEVKEKFLEATNNIEFIKRLISPDRPYAKDLPRDKSGKIIVDICNPHILTDMDYFRPTAIHYQKYHTLTNLRPNANPNSEFGKWIRTEMDRIWNGMIRESDGEWVTGDMYFYMNYTPIKQTLVGDNESIGDRVIDLPKTWEGIYLWYHYVYQARYGGIYNNFRGGQHGAEIAKRGASKAHPYSQLVNTPEGIKLWGDIKVGDSLYGDDNKITKVIDIPFDDVTDVYKITLKDKRKIFASEDHLWKVWKHTSSKRKEYILSTKELLSNYKKVRKITKSNPTGIEYIYRIPKNEGVEYDFIEVPIDPYTFGLLLGDGSFCGNWVNYAYLSSADIDFRELKNYIPYSSTKWNTKYGIGLHINNFKSILLNFNLWHKKSENKFIPLIYKTNSKEVRIELLKGLFDSDGYVDKNMPVISLSSKKMIEDIAWICRSLGINCSITKKETGYKKEGIYIKCLPSYTLRVFTDTKFFKLKRKGSLQGPLNTEYAKSRMLRTSITNIEFSHRERSKCVTVDNNSHCYLIGDFVTTHNSYTCAAILAKLFILGENAKVKKNTNGVIIAHDKEKLIKDGTLNKFVDIIDFCAENTQFPSHRLVDSINKMDWQMGYIDPIKGTHRGTLNETLGVAINDDPDKARGKRCNKLIYEEFGAFPKFLSTWGVNKRSVQEGNVAFGQSLVIGTGGSKGSNFQGALELIYNPVGQNIYALPNVFDKNTQGKQQTIFFFGAYLNRAGYYNQDGVSDVTGALIEILLENYKIKYNTSDPATLVQAIAEDPITIQDAIMRDHTSIYPVADITETINQLDQDIKSFDKIWVGKLILKDNKVEYSPDTSLSPIRDFPHKNNKLTGAVEIYELPIINRENTVYPNRYIGGIDPYDDDVSDTLSLGSIFILDLWTDEIVFEYTGRPNFADDFYEICRRALLFYNARCNYENNKKGIFKYFSQHNCLYLLTDTLEFLKDKDIIRTSNFGNKAKGTLATAGTKAYARRCIRDWLLQPINKTVTVDGEETIITVPKVTTLKQRALLKELSLWNSEGNFDRHDALGMLMLLREDKLRLLGDGKFEEEETINKAYLGKDDFFTKNYDMRVNRGFVSKHISESLSS